MGTGRRAGLTADLDEMGYEGGERSFVSQEVRVNNRHRHTDHDARQHEKPRIVCVAR